MTLLEAFKFKSGNKIPNSEATLSLQFVGLNPSDAFDQSNKVQMCKFYEAICGEIEKDYAGVQSITEGGFSMTFDKAQKSKYLESLAKESGCKNLIDKYSTSIKIKNKSSLW